MKVGPVPKNWIAILLFFILGWVIYANTLQSAFHFDDYTYIVNKAQIRDVTDWRSIYKALGHPSRFIAFYSFAINYHFHTYDVYGYHLVNILIHCLNAILVYFLVGRLLSCRPFSSRLREGDAFGCALVGGLLFLVHPLQTESVTYIVQRFTSLATFFYLAAIGTYLQARQNQSKKGLGFYLCFVVFTILGMFTKQICFTIPVMVVFLEWICFGDDFRKFIRKRWMVLILLGGLLLVIPSFFGFNAANIIGREVPSRSHTGETLNSYRYALTQTRVVPTYLRLVVFPHGQNLDYDFTTSYHWQDWRVLGGSLFLLVLLGGVVFLKHKFPEYSLGMGWFFLTISVTSSIIPIPHVIFEHRTYLPLVGLCFLFSIWLYRIQTKRWRLLAIVFVVGGLAVLTHQRNKVWQTEESLWLDIVKKSPNKLRAYNNLGMAKFKQGDAQPSIDYFNQAIARNPEAGRVYNNRGLVYLALGNNQQALADFNQAIELFEGSEAYHKKNYKRIWAQIYFNRGQLRQQLGDQTGGTQDIAKALQIDANHTGALFFQGHAHERQADFTQAQAKYIRILEVDPRHKAAMLGLGFVTQIQEEDREAIGYFDSVIRLYPEEGEAYFFRGISRYNLGDLPGAQSDMRQAAHFGFEGNTPELRAARQKILALE